MTLPARLVRQIPLNVWFRLRRTVENTSTILLVLSRESNAKTCASLVLCLEKEATAWSLRERTRPSRGFHTPACLLDGWTATTEVIRSLVRGAGTHTLPRATPRLMFMKMEAPQRTSSVSELRTNGLYSDTFHPIHRAWTQTMNPLPFLLEKKGRRSLVERIFSVPCGPSRSLMAFAAIFVPNFTFQAIARSEPELRMRPVAVIEGQPPRPTGSSRSTSWQIDWA